MDHARSAGSGRARPRWGPAKAELLSVPACRCTDVTNTPNKSRIRLSILPGFVTVVLVLIITAVDMVVLRFSG